MMTFPSEWKNKSHVPVTTNHYCIEVVNLPNYLKEKMVQEGAPYSYVWWFITHLIVVYCSYIRYEP